MQKNFFPGQIRIFNGKKLISQNQNFLQKKYSKFSFDHIFHRIVIKFEPVAHLNVVCKSNKAVNCYLSILGYFDEKLKKSLKIEFYLSEPIFIFYMSLRLSSNTKCVEKNMLQALLMWLTNMRVNRAFGSTVY